MKNSSKSKYFGKNRKQQKRNFNSNFDSKNTNFSKINNRFLIKSSKNMSEDSLNRSDNKNFYIRFIY